MKRGEEVNMIAPTHPITLLTKIIPTYPLILLTKRDNTTIIQTLFDFLEEL